MATEIYQPCCRRCSRVFDELIIAHRFVGNFGLGFSELQQFVTQAPDLLDSFVNLVDQIEKLLKNANIQVNLDFLQEDLKQEVSNLLSFGTALAKFYRV